jgi:hypothetical protein
MISGRGGLYLKRAIKLDSTTRCSFSTLVRKYMNKENNETTEVDIREQQL